MASGLKLRNEESEVNSSFKRQGSLRRVLPPFSSVDAVGNTNIVTSSAAKMIDRPTLSNVDNRNDYVSGGSARIPIGIEQIVSQEYFILSEYQKFMKKQIPGMYVIPSAASSYVWFGVLFVRHGVYQGGVFRFQVKIPQTYPNGGTPRFIFETPIFHPMVDPHTGELSIIDGNDTKDSEGKWRDICEKVGHAVNERWNNYKHVWQVLISAQHVVENVELENPSNEDAAKLYRENYEEFVKRAVDAVHHSLEHIHDLPSIRDPHYFNFQHHNEITDVTLQKNHLNPMTWGSSDSATSSTIGSSWIQPGALIPFSKFSFYGSP